MEPVPAADGAQNRYGQYVFAIFHALAVVTRAAARQAGEIARSHRERPQNLEAGATEQSGAPGALRFSRKHYFC